MLPIDIIRMANGYVLVDKFIIINIDIIKLFMCREIK